MSRLADRNPDSYSIGMPQVLFSPIPDSGDFSSWVDHVALSAAFTGLTDNAGNVVNGQGRIVGTPASIMAECYLGSLDSASLGGDVETLEHTVSNLGYEEVDRIVALQRPYEYTLSFDEPDIKNMSRFMLSQETNLGMSLRNVTASGVTFKGSETETVTVIDRKIGNPDLALDTVMALWYSETGGKTLPPNGTYGFIIGGTNEEECVGAWLNRRQWVAYAYFDFGAKTVGAWSYIRPHGTALDGLYGGDAMVPINGVIVSVIDSQPVANRCGASLSWNADAFLAWTGFGWYGSDEGFFGYSVVGTQRAFKRTNGAAVVAKMTEIGNSSIHIIPRCTMMPDGGLSFSADDWTKGSFKLRVLRDSKAAFTDRVPAVPIPFGYMQTFNLLQTEI